jgi:hypothetical protein
MELLVILGTATTLLLVAHFAAIIRNSLTQQ